MSETFSTEELVRRSRGKDRTAFDELAERFRVRLEDQIRARMGTRVRERIEVEDIVQETFLKAYEYIGELEWRGEEAFASWLGCVAEFLIRKATQGTSRAPLELARDYPDSAPSAGHLLDREERLRRLGRALAGLSPDHRQVIVLARIERLKVAEIARRMSRSPNAVKKLLARALLELKGRFGDTTGSLRLPDLPLEIGGSSHEV